MLRVVLMLWMLLSGCSAMQFFATHHERVSEQRVDMRVTSAPADVAGTQCYVDYRVRVVTAKRISHNFHRAAAGEVVVGGLVSLFGEPAMYFGLPVLADGLETALFLLLRNNEETSHTGWEQSNDTAPCKR